MKSQRLRWGFAHVKGHSSIADLKTGKRSLLGPIRRKYLVMARVLGRSASLTPTGSGVLGRALLSPENGQHDKKQIGTTSDFIYSVRM